MAAESEKIAQSDSITRKVEKKASQWEVMMNERLWKSRDPLAMQKYSLKLTPIGEKITPEFFWFFDIFWPDLFNSKSDIIENNQTAWNH